MSTIYRIHGRGRRLSVDRLAKTGCTILTADPERGSYGDDHVCIEMPGGSYLHFYRTSKAAWNLFERFGGNSAEWMLDWLCTHGYSVTTEHGEAIC